MTKKKLDKRPDNPRIIEPHSPLQDPKQKPLSPRQERFVEEYLKDFNQTQAALRAGYSPRSARTTASENMRKPNIIEAIRVLTASQVTERIADATETLETLTAIMRGETRSHVLRGVGKGEEVIDPGMPPTTAERLSAAEKLGKAHGIFTDRLAVEGDVQIIINDDIDADDEV